MTRQEDHDSEILRMLSNGEAGIDNSKRSIGKPSKPWVGDKNVSLLLAEIVQFC